MAKKKFRLLEPAVAAGADVAQGRAAGDEFEHDFYNQEAGWNSEQAVIAAGWVEPVDEEPAKAEQKKGGVK